MVDFPRALTAAVAASRTAVTAWWWWLVTPPPKIWPNPPIPDDRNAAGLGWAGDRREIRPFNRKEQG